MRIGIELASGRVSALVAAPDGSELGRASAWYPVLTPGEGRAESSPAHWWTALRSAVWDALAEADAADAVAQAGPAPGQVTELGVTAHLHGTVLTESDGRPLRPAILRPDLRATAEAAEFADLPDDLTAALGDARPAPGMTGPLLLWLARHEPATLHAAWWVLQPVDWLRLRLTGQALTGPDGGPGTLLFDPLRGTWATSLIEKLGLPAGKLPPVRPAGTGPVPGRPAGEPGPLLPGPAREPGLLPGPAHELGLLPGIPVRG